MGGLGDLWVDVRRHLLDAAGLAAAQLGPARRHAGCLAPGTVQLLDRHVYRRRRPGGAWRCPGARRGSTHSGHFRTRDFFWLALGMAILATSRPYEGLFISIPALAALAWWWFNSRPSRAPAPPNTHAKFGRRAHGWRLSQAHLACEPVRVRIDSHATDRARSSGLNPHDCFHWLLRLPRVRKRVHSAL